MDAETPIHLPPDEKYRFIGKDPDGGNDRGQEEKGVTEDEMVGWLHTLNGQEFEQTQGDRTGKPVVLQFMVRQRVRHI